MKKRFTPHTFRKIIEDGAGFTLIEMLVVVAIIGLLSSIILVGLGDVRREARDTRRIADIRQFQNSLEIYYSSNQSYPSDPYESLEAVPYDPVLDPITGEVRKYGYERLSPNSYLLGACLEGERQAGIGHVTETLRNGIDNYGDGCNCDEPDNHVYCVKS